LLSAAPRGIGFAFHRARAPESKNMHPCGIKKYPFVFQYNITFIKVEWFSFAVPSTAKEIIFNSAAFAS